MRIPSALPRVGVVLALSACTPDASSVSSVSEGITVCPGTNVLEGIDVAAYEPNTDWTKVKAAKRSFAFIKATEGTTYKNSYFDQDWKGTKAVGILRGAYHFFHVNVDPVAQADFFVQKMGALVPGDLPPMLDLEVRDGQSASTTLANAKKWLARVEQTTGRKAVIYTYPDMWLNQLGDPTGFGAYPLAMASFGSCPPLPKSWQHITFWQYSESGTVSGVNNAGATDLDRFYGTMADLVALANGGAANPDLGSPGDGGVASDAGSGSDAAIAPEMGADAGTIDGPPNAPPSAGCQMSPVATSSDGAWVLLLGFALVGECRRRRRAP
jgi:GH25 family lysozyme M1 (1,4-beta-N-acetylmuramidase)